MSRIENTLNRKQYGNLSKFFILKKGDLIYTGTPKGVGPVKIGDRLEAYLEDQKMLHVDVK